MIYLEIVAKFIVPDWGVKVDSRIRLSCLRSLAGLYDKPYARVNFNPPVKNYEFGYSGWDLGVFILSQ